MKLASYNVKGFHNTAKVRALWQWLYTNDIDVLCVQEHNKHECGGQLAHHQGYTSFYGGSMQFSGTLIIVRDQLSPTLAFNHALGCLLGVNIITDDGPLLITNVYGPHASVPRSELW